MNPTAESALGKKAFLISAIRLPPPLRRHCRFRSPFLPYSHLINVNVVRVGSLDRQRGRENFSRLLRLPLRTPFKFRFKLVVEIEEQAKVPRNFIFFEETETDGIWLSLSVGAYFLRCRRWTSRVISTHSPFRKFASDKKPHVCTRGQTDGAADKLKFRSFHYSLAWHASGSQVTTNSAGQCTPTLTSSLFQSAYRLDKYVHFLPRG